MNIKLKYKQGIIQQFQKLQSKLNLDTADGVKDQNTKKIQKNAFSKIYQKQLKSLIQFSCTYLTQMIIKYVSGEAKLKTLNLTMINLLKKRRICD